MKRTDWRFLALCGLVAILWDAHPAVGQYGQVGYGPQGGGSIWIEGEPDYFRRGDRLNVRFSVPYDAYVAVVHVDTDGNLEFLYPGTPWDVQMVRAGRVHSLPARGTFANTTIRSRAGIGYLYLIASPYPLDFSYFRSRLGSTWDWGYAGRTVHGDPFLAFEQLARLMVPRWPYAPYLFDYHGYYVEGIHRYPSFACSDRAYSSGWGWTPGFGTCSRLDFFLRDHPYYYDTRRFRGDRRALIRPYDSLDPRHGFKEDPRGGASTMSPRTGVTDIRSPAFGGTNSGDVQRREPAGQQVPRREAEPPSRSAVPERAAPPPPRSPAPQRAPAPARETPPPARGEPAVPPRAEPAAPPPSRTAEPERRPAATGRAAPPAAAPAATGTRARPTTGTDDRGTTSTSDSRGSAPARGRP
jgi:hypothetical protein